LKSTQNTFEAPLLTLDNWTRIIRREPTEEEFKQALATKDILLYFGHGSGAQYIRGRTIRRLDRCAVVFLMGCSSGSMTEAGEFESYGTPVNYMHAGAPALVATLWDVTDKDIDRFAKAAFEQWGLLKTTDAHDHNIEMESSNLRSNKAAKRRQPKALGLPSEIASIGLDTAVSNSRGACILRYLNGAAPVVYGVPVFLL
jgi:separase